MGREVLPEVAPHPQIERSRLEDRRFPAPQPGDLQGAEGIGWGQVLLELSSACHQKCAAARQTAVKPAMIHRKVGPEIEVKRSIGIDHVLHSPGIGSSVGLRRSG